MRRVTWLCAFLTISFSIVGCQVLDTTVCDAPMQTISWNHTFYEADTITFTQTVLGQTFSAISIDFGQSSSVLYTFDLGGRETITVCRVSNFDLYSHYFQNLVGTNHRLSNVYRDQLCGVTTLLQSATSGKYGVYMSSTTGNTSSLYSIVHHSSSNEIGLTSITNVGAALLPNSQCVVISNGYRGNLTSSVLTLFSSSEDVPGKNFFIDNVTLSCSWSNGQDIIVGGKCESKVSMGQMSIERGGLSHHPRICYQIIIKSKFEFISVHEKLN